MIQKSITRLIAVVLLSASLAGCHGNDPYRRAWYDVYGNYCGSGYPYPGCNYYANGSKIYATQDPFYSGSVYYYDLWSYYDSYGYYRFYLGYAWMSNTGILYDQFGYALNQESENREISSDVIAAAAEKEKALAVQAGKSFAEKYALAEEKGIMISKTLQDWALLARDRVREDTDVEIYLSKLYGVDAGKVSQAVSLAKSSGNIEILGDLNVDVAAHWGTTPEVSKKILQKWYQDELSSMGLK